MKGEKTTKGNSYNLTRYQHIIPNKSINRFVDRDGKVLITLNSPPKSFRGKPDNPAFCVNRVWDHRSERVWMKRIEDKYQNIADLCSIRLQLKLIHEQHEIVSRMYLLIYLRIKFDLNPPNDSDFISERTTTLLSKDKHEFLESRGITSLTSTGKFSSRHITGSLIQMRVDQNYLAEFSSTKWDIVSATRSKYIFSDSYNGYKVLPISPELCFVARHDIVNEPRLLDSDFINEVGIKNSCKLYFSTCTDKQPQILS